MITVREAQDRGRTETGWLDSAHTFSFGEYYDRSFTGFRDLLVINDDRITPGAGFGTHGHKDMEIVSWVVEGSLQHRDSLGSGSVLTPGMIQRMSAGTGIRHSEFNPSGEQSLRFLQIWIQPERKGLSPGYEEKTIPRDDLTGKLREVASWNPKEGSVKIHQDVSIFAARLEKGDEVRHTFVPGRHGWIQVVFGRATVQGIGLSEGDGAAISGENEVLIAGNAKSEILLFDLR